MAYVLGGKETYFSYYIGKIRSWMMCDVNKLKLNGQKYSAAKYEIIPRIIMVGLCVIPATANGSMRLPRIFYIVQL